jgi:hypothetical protein
MPRDMRPIATVSAALVPVMRVDTRDDRKARTGPGERGG